MTHNLQTTQAALQLLPAEEPGKAELKEQFIELRAKGLSYAKKPGG